MGQDIQQSEITQETIKRFTQHLLRDFKALALLLDRGMIESGVERIGAEQELGLVGPDWEPAPLAMEILEEVINAISSR